MISILLALVVCVLAAAAWKRSSRVPLPPKLAKRPAEVAKRYPWQEYAEQSAILGPLLSLPSFQQPIIVISTARAIADTFERRSATFSCKPRWPMAELLGRQRNVGFTYYGDRLQKSRKVLHAALNEKRITDRSQDGWRALLEEQSARLMRDFNDRPQNWWDSVENRVQKLVVRFAYGRDPNPEYLALAKKVMHETGIALQPGRWKVNIFPILMYVPAWFPGAGFQRWARAAKDSFFAMTRLPFQDVRKQLNEGSAPACFVQQALSEMGPQNVPEQEDIIMCAAGSLFSAGTETIIGSMLTFLALMATHPAVQQELFAEIARTVGLERLPDLSDQTALKYLDAALQESHRVNPAIPLVTHSNSREETYEGMVVPKKSWLMANVWSVLHDAETYPDPEAFRPERFLGATPQPDPRGHIYGFGRRRCPGLHFANAWLFLCAARTVALFEILPEERGGKTYPQWPLELKLGLVPMPVEFKGTLRPRPHAAEVLARMEFEG